MQEYTGVETQQIGTLRHPCLRVTQCFEVHFSREAPGCVVVDCPEFTIYGEGATRTEALQDLLGAIVELYEGLEGQQELGPLLAQLRDTMQAKIQRVRNPDGTRVQGGRG